MRGRVRICDPATGGVIRRPDGTGCFSPRQARRYLAALPGGACCRALTNGPDPDQPS